MAKSLEAVSRSFDTFTLCILLAVLTTSFFAFVLGAEAELIVVLLTLGTVTAIAEFKFRKAQSRAKH